MTTILYADNKMNEWDSILEKHKERCYSCKRKILCGKKRISCKHCNHIIKRKIKKLIPIIKEKAKKIIPIEKVQMTLAEKRKTYRQRPDIKEKEKLLFFKRYIKRVYNISFNEYEEMLKKQNGVCAICHKNNSKNDYRTNECQRMHIDHCHKTGNVRGLLCNKCNQGIGFFEDNIILLASSIIYLQKSKN
jgi:copper chaperone CopZ